MKNKNEKAFAKLTGKLSVVPLGGLGEIGKNMTAIVYNDEIIVIDCGMMFPEDDLLGIDMVIPDYTYLKDNKDKVKAVVLTHGHEDHIGTLPYFLRDFDVPVYGSKLTLGIVEGKLKENRLKNYHLNVIKPLDVLKIGSFKIEFIRVSHSIAGAVALAIQTPAGILVHTGDFKFDMTPIDHEPVDFQRLAAIGEKNVLALMSDSTNVERPGYTPSERSVGQTFDEMFRGAKNRIIVASFASNVHRVQQAIWAAAKYNRKVALVGRSMVNVANIAQELGYLKVPKNTLIDIDEVNKLPRNRVAILTTGSQGEPMSGLTRMSLGEHKQIKILEGDTIIISAVPIPGNEKSVSKSIDHLHRLGADVIYESYAGIHVSGHASQEELKLMLSLIRPKFFIPVHGEYRMLCKHAKLAEEMGIPKDNIFISSNGQPIDFQKGKGSFGKKVTAGKVLIDGLGIGDVGNVVLRDRKILSEDGILIVTMVMEKGTGKLLARPDIVSRGFVYVREADILMKNARKMVKTLVDGLEPEKAKDWSYTKNLVRDQLGKYLYDKTKRRPMVLPIITEV